MTYLARLFSSFQTNGGRKNTKILKFTLQKGWHEVAFLQTSFVLKTSFIFLKTITVEQLISFFNKKTYITLKKSYQTQNFVNQEISDICLSLNGNHQKY